MPQGVCDFCKKQDELTGKWLGMAFVYLCDACYQESEPEEENE